MSTTLLGRSASVRARKCLQAFSAVGAGALSGEEGSGTTSKRVRQATIEAMERHDCDHYTRRPGLAALCQRVADTLVARGIEVDPGSGVIITGSVEEARFVALRSLAAGKTVYVPGPAPPAYNAGVDFAGATVQAIEPDGTLPSANSDLLVLPNPHLTTGQLLAQATLNRLAAWAIDENLTVVADETHASGSMLPSLAALPDLASRTVIIGRFAAPGLAAWQVSWIAGPPDLVTTVRDVKQAMTICTPAPSQYAALASFEDRTGPSDQGRERR